MTIARSAPAAHHAVTARFSDYRRESSTYSVRCSRFALQLPVPAGSGPVLCGISSLYLTLADLTRKPASSALTIQPALWFAPSLLCLPCRGDASFRFFRPLAPFEAVDSIRRFPGLRFVHIIGITPSMRTFLHHQPPRSQAYFIPEAPMGFSLQGFPLKRRSTCSHTLHSLMLLRRRWPPYLLPRALGCNAIRSPFSFRVLSVVRVRSRGLRCLAAGPVVPLLRFSFLGFCPQRSIGNPFRPPPLVPLGERAPVKFLAIHRLQSLFATP